MKIRVFMFGVAGISIDKFYTPYKIRMALQMATSHALVSDIPQIILSFTSIICMIVPYVARCC